MRVFGMFMVGAAFVAASAVTSTAATVYADSVVEAIVGTGNRGPQGNTDPAVTATGAPDGAFYSPGIGGLLVLDFPVDFSALPGNEIGAFEVTFVCDNSGGLGCDNFPEAAELFIGAGWTTGGGTVANALAINPGFTSIGTIYNNQAQGGVIVATVSQAFSQLVLVDRSVANGLIETVNAGFDVDAIGVTPVPVPAALPLLAGGLALMGLLGRRRSMSA